MLTSSFIFAKGMSEELERALWAKGLTTWDALRKHRGEAIEILGNNRAQKLTESVAEAQQALERKDHAWFRAHWPERENWRLWKGLADQERIALVDIETTGLTPGYDQITVIGLADGTSARAFVAGKPQAGDEMLPRFIEVIRSYQLIVTFNGAAFDVPFIEKHFREANFHFDQPHIDLMPPARSLGLGGGLKDMEKALGITRSAEIKDMRGHEAIQLWGAWRNGDLAAYKKLTTYCKADCVNLKDFAEAVYSRKWAKVFTAHAREFDFDAIKGQQQSLF
ncbi:MAG: ribonuclease H-like domain-containing protein [Planctomycetes bacterium]|nr:ribonuclease H-like domain-containing protein [Planctomycetota bacterium]